MSAALIVVDMMNPYRHGDADALKSSVRQVVPAIETLIHASRSADVPVVYVNDNHEDWSAGRQEIVSQALAGTAPELVEPIAPGPGSSFIVKARHSIFYQTPLEYMLRQRRIDRLILTGQVTEQCILYSALDGYVRRFEIAVGSDCVAHIHPHLAEAALEMIQLNMRGHVASGMEALESAARRR